MARFVDVHPENPQARLISQVAEAVRGGSVIAYPTDLSYALGCRLGDAAGLDRIREIRALDAKHHFTLMCRDFSQASQFVKAGNAAFRAIKASTPGPYTFVLPATKDVPRRLLHPKKHTVGIRIPRHPVVLAILDELGEPIVSTTLHLPSDEAPLTQGWEIKERLDHVIDLVVDAGDCTVETTTLVDLSEDEPEVLRVGAGDPSRFE